MLKSYSIGRVVVWTLAGALPLLFGQATRANQAGNTPHMDMEKPGIEKAGTVSAGDRDFIEAAAPLGIAEVKLGKLADERAMSPTVKDYAKQMVDDHSAANDRLKDLATKKNIEMPQDMTGEQKAAYDRLAKLKGAEFDSAYMKQMVADHHMAMQLFQRQAKMGKDPEIKSFAKSTLPTLQKHHMAAQQDIKKM